MATTNYNLPTITGNMTSDVVRDMNALAEATDGAIKQAVEGVDLSQITQEVSKVDTKLTQHLAEIATSTKIGHVKGGGNITVSPDGTINTRTGSTAQTGVVQLNSTLTSTSTTQAATASTVKSLNDTKANKIDLTQSQNDLNDHLADMAKHNQIMDGSQKVQLVFGINKILNCLTVEEVII